jgi:hypothetical protein
MMANQSSGIGWQRGSKRRSQQASPTESSNDGSESKAGLEAMGSAVHRGSVLRDTGEAYGENIVFQALVLYHTTCLLLLFVHCLVVTTHYTTHCYILLHLATSTTWTCISTSRPRSESRASGARMSRASRPCRRTSQVISCLKPRSMRS